MKHILFLFSVVYCCFSSTAQMPPPGSERYYPELDKYVGTWQWSTSNETIILQLKKIHYLSKTGEITKDVLMGCHKYIKNGVTVEDYLPIFSQVGQTKKGSTLIWMDWHHPKPDTLDGMLADVLKKKSQHIEIIYVAGTVPQLVCKVYSSEGMIIPPTLPGVTLPASFTLLKQ